MTFKVGQLYQMIASGWIVVITEVSKTRIRYRYTNSPYDNVSTYMRTYDDFLGRVVEDKDFKLEFTI